VNAAWRTLRGSEAFRREVEARLGAGEADLAECGNLYAASILAWMAAGLGEAAGAGPDLAGARVLAVGYGSGDAADASILRVADAWREAAGKIGFAAALGDAIDLDRAAYEAVHDGRPRDGVPDVTSDGFAIDRVGWRRGPRSDAGVEYHGYDPGDTD